MGVQIIKLTHYSFAKLIKFANKKKSSLKKTGKKTGLKVIDSIVLSGHPSKAYRNL